MSATTVEAINAALQDVDLSPAVVFALQRVGQHLDRSLQDLDLRLGRAEAQVADLDLQVADLDDET